MASGAPLQPGASPGVVMAWLAHAAMQDTDLADFISEQIVQQLQIRQCPWPEWTSLAHQPLSWSPSDGSWKSPVSEPGPSPATWPWEPDQCQMDKRSQGQSQQAQPGHLVPEEASEQGKPEAGPLAQELLRVLLPRPPCPERLLMSMLEPRPVACRDVRSRRGSPPPDGQDWHKVKTVVIEGLPQDCTREVLVREIMRRGFRHTFNRLHLPKDPAAGKCLGYSVINFYQHEDAVRFRDSFNMKAFSRADKLVLRVKPAETQGLQQSASRFLKNKDVEAPPDYSAEHDLLPTELLQRLLSEAPRQKSPNRRLVCRALHDAGLQSSGGKPRGGRPWATGV